MIQYRFLDGTNSKVLHQAFMAAFADYQVKFDVSLEEFEHRLLRDGVSVPLSIGAFCDEQLVGFCLNSPGLWQGHSTIYDAGTGVLPRFRRQGIAKEMFKYAIPQLKALGVKQYLLEVLTTNHAAKSLYYKLGFTEARRFGVFRSATPFSSTKTSNSRIQQAKVPDWQHYMTFWSSYPSWQNSIEAANRVLDTVVVLEAHVNDQCVGYGVVSRITGNLFQLAVDRKYRRKGIGSKLLDELQRHVAGSEPLKVNNVDEQLVMTVAFFNAVGFAPALEQHELILSDFS